MKKGIAKLPKADNNKLIESVEGKSLLNELLETVPTLESSNSDSNYHFFTNQKN